MKQLTTQQIEAILDGRKTQFREVCKRQLLATRTIESKDSYCMSAFIEQESIHQTGDTLWKDTEYESVVTGVRVERLQCISDDDCIAEGVSEVGFYPDDGFPLCSGYMIGKDDGKTPLHNTPQKTFIKLWNSTAKDCYKWEDNPYVFVYEFEKVKNG